MLFPMHFFAAKISTYFEKWPVGFSVRGYGKFVRSFAQSFLTVSLFATGAGPFDVLKSSKGP